MTVIQRFYGLYKSLDGNPNDNLMDIFEYLEMVQPVVATWIGSNFLDMARYVSDDTTSGRTLDLQSQSKKLSELIDRLLDEYLGISDEEALQLKSGTKTICEDLAVIHFSTDGYSAYMESIQNNTFALENIEMTPYVADLAAQGTPTLIDDIRTVLEILVRFEVYMPEYTLSEDDLDMLIEYMEENNLSTFELGRLDSKTVRRGLNDE